MVSSEPLDGTALGSLALHGFYVRMASANRFEYGEENATSISCTPPFHRD
jgi:hypothetical protein